MPRRGAIWMLVKSKKGDRKQHGGAPPIGPSIVVVASPEENTQKIVDDVTTNNEMIFTIKVDNVNYDIYPLTRDQYENLNTVRDGIIDEFERIPGTDQWRRALGRTIRRLKSVHTDKLNIDDQHHLLVQNKLIHLYKAAERHPNDKNLKNHLDKAIKAEKKIKNKLNEIRHINDKLQAAKTPKEVEEYARENKIKRKEFGKAVKAFHSHVAAAPPLPTRRAPIAPGLKIPGLETQSTTRPVRPAPTGPVRSASLQPGLKTGPPTPLTSSLGSFTGLPPSVLPTGPPTPPRRQVVVRQVPTVQPQQAVVQPAPESPTRPPSPTLMQVLARPTPPAHRQGQKRAWTGGKQKSRAYITEQRKEINKMLRRVKAKMPDVGKYLEKNLREVNKRYKKAKRKDTYVKTYDSIVKNLKKTIKKHKL